MIFPDYSLEDWCKQHKIKPLTDYCRNCKKETTTTIPFASKFGRGLISEEHGCGESYRIQTIKPRGKLLEMLERVCGK